MKFYGRLEELRKIKSYYDGLSDTGSKIIAITGRRRIGKTRLALESVKEIKHLYFFVSRKRETELVREWTEEIRKNLNTSIYGEFRNMEDLLNFLFDHSKQSPLTVIFDEFQNFYFSNSASFSVFQKVFDLRKQESRLLLIFSGSSYSMMSRIFTDAKEPLFSRASEIIRLSYLTLKDQQSFLEDQKIISFKDRLLLFSIFNGVPKYLEEIAFFNEKLLTTRLNKLLLQREWIWEEGENILREEFGKDYVTYFSILSAIAKGRRILSEIEHFAGIKDAGAYLIKLDSVYNIIERRLPVTSKSHKEKKGRYYIKDNFFDFWLRYIEANRVLKEIGQINLFISNLSNEMQRYLGRKFEDYIIRLFIEENPLNLRFNRIGKYWNRKGSIEIDILITDDKSKSAWAFECKLNRNIISQKLLNNLKEKVTIIPELRGYRFYIGYAYPENGNVRIKLEAQ